ncbi:MAG: hypothetical protein HY927_08270 [Elusimicrobia bacterium]|nr:hypothetical protein [Elusimicrobiota bacterium]
MPTKPKSQSPHQRIIVGLPNLQDNIRMVRRLSNAAAESEQTRWTDLEDLLSELYTQLQHQKQVTVYRFGSRDRYKTAAGRDSA